MKKKLAALFLTILLALSVVGCASGADNTQPSATTAPTATIPPTEAATPSAEPASLNVGFLKGPTGIGASYFIDQAENGQYATDYNITLESDATIITSSIISGELDVAAVPTNAAAAIFNKTSGGVQIIAINTLGVLYILENGDTVNSVADLEGKTIYATGQAANPEYVLNYILEQNGLTPGEDVTIEFLPNDEIVTKMASGEIDLCMLPVPFTTSVLMKNADVRVALDLNGAWDDVSTDGSVLTQGCLIARTDVDPAAITLFLSDYSQSITYVSDTANLDAAAALCAQYEIVGSAEVAKAAIPDSSITFVSGLDDMKAMLAGYYSVLFAADPTSIGGAIPGDDFYFAG